MYRRSRRHKKFPDLALAILGVVAFVTLGALLFINDKQEKEQQAKYEQIAREEREKQKEIETQYNIILTQDNILDSRINMTRLVPQLRVLHKSQPA